MLNRGGIGIRKRCDHNLKVVWSWRGCFKDGPSMGSSHMRPLQKTSSMNGVIVLWLLATIEETNATESAA